MSDTINYSEDLKKVVHIAQSIAKEYSNPHFSGAHLLKALMHKDVGLMQLMINLGKDIYFIEEWADVRIEQYPKGKAEDPIRADNKVVELMEEADIIRLKMGKAAIDPVCVLAALCIPGLVFSYDQLKTFPIKQEELVKEGADQQNLAQTFTSSLNGASENTTGTGALLKYCIDKTERAKQGKLDNIIGRDREVRMMAEILGRRSKPNVIIVGEPGVGKTALVDGFAVNITEGHVPGALKNARIFELDFGSLVAGASYKGEIEDRLKKILAEIRQFDKAILFIDEL
ncbi:MAG: ATP-dependent Clp protease ATP-binding subunit, partial [Crocinitomicaceae bacterium]|nr:ATP-dependent Clp protease ATP-binding subunit [Crocinitomicaceae bacterium]